MFVSASVVGSATVSAAGVSVFKPAINASPSNDAISTSPTVFLTPDGSKSEKSNPTVSLTPAWSKSEKSKPTVFGNAPWSISTVSGSKLGSKDAVTTFASMVGMSSLAGANGLCGVSAITVLRVSCACESNDAKVISVALVLSSLNKVIKISILPSDARCKGSTVSVDAIKVAGAVGETGAVAMCSGADVVVCVKSAFACKSTTSLFCPLSIMVAENNIAIPATAAAATRAGRTKAEKKPSRFFIGAASLLAGLKPAVFSRFCLSLGPISTFESLVKISAALARGILTSGC